MLKTWCLIRSLYKCICKNLVRKLWTVSAILMLKLVTLTMQDSPKYLKRAKFPPCCSWSHLPQPQSKIKVVLFLFESRYFLANNLCFFGEMYWQSKSNWSCSWREKSSLLIFLQVWWASTISSKFLFVFRVKCYFTITQNA